MGLRFWSRPGATSGGSTRSITKTIAITVIAVNLIGLAVTSFAISEMSGASQTDSARRNWLKDTAQIGAQAAGGVKWGKAEAIRSAYSIFQDDPKLGLIGLAAFNQAGDQVDVWTRADTPDPALASVLSTPPKDVSDPVFSEADGSMIIEAALPADKDGASLGHLKTVWSTTEIGQASRAFALEAMALQAVVLLLSVAVLLLAMRRFVGKPLARINRRIGALQEGDTSSPVPCADNDDEIGTVARALSAFCQASRTKLEADAEMARQREQLDAERQSNLSETERAAATQRAVVGALGTALERLAAGDLTARVPDLGGEFATLQDNFNRALTALEQTVGTIDSAQQAVRQASGSLGRSTDELARRTEQQAASLEETAAALDEITSTVKVSSAQAIEAGELVGVTRDAAASSSGVVSSAIEAMSQIEESSAKIAQILNMIDEIAFQTNLLALNAGVEAARAGEAGKGFAVVAQEVRDLAGRSATAAKEIKVLIELSSRQVSSGVDLVNKTGESMAQIEHHIAGVADKIALIAKAAREQATGLSQVNMAITEMDTMTQKNAAMVQDSNLASQNLSGECERLAGVVTSFRLSAAASSARVSNPTPQPVPARVAPEARQAGEHGMTARPRTQARGNAALAATTDSWEEF